MSRTWVPNPGIRDEEDNMHEPTVTYCVRCGEECFLGDEVNPRDAKCPNCGLVEYESERKMDIFRQLDRFEGGKKLYTDKEYY